MATKIVTVSDLSGSEGAQPRNLVVNGRTRVIDLTAEEYAELKAAQELYNRFLSVSSILPGASSVRVKSNAPKPRIVRAWALANGYLVGDRGRIAAHIYDAYGRNV